MEKTYGVSRERLAQETYSGRCEEKMDRKWGGMK